MFDSMLLEQQTLPLVNMDPLHSLPLPNRVLRCSVVGTVSLLLQQLRVIGIDAATLVHGDHRAQQLRSFVCDKLVGSR